MLCGSSAPRCVTRVLLSPSFLLSNKLAAAPAEPLGMVLVPRADPSPPLLRRTQGSLSHSAAWEDLFLWQSRDDVAVPVPGLSLRAQQGTLRAAGGSDCRSGRLNISWPFSPQTFPHFSWPPARSCREHVSQRVNPECKMCWVLCAVCAGV